MDIVVSVGMLVVCLPLGLSVATLIKATSRGPIFFRQERVGHQGRKFRIWKFRTMHAGTDATVHAEYVKQLLRAEATLHKIDCQFRMIPLGKLLRLLAIDELPQLWNVLAGDMSLVGPRPDVVPLDEYEPWQRARFDVLPGLTGLWQVSGKNRTTFQEMIELDLGYIRRRSLGLDLRILAMTLPAIVQQCRDASATQRALRRAETTLDAGRITT